SSLRNTSGSTSTERRLRSVPKRTSRPATFRENEAFLAMRICSAPLSILLRWNQGCNLRVARDSLSRKHRSCPVRFKETPVLLDADQLLGKLRFLYGHGATIRASGHCERI